MDVEAQDLPLTGCVTGEAVWHRGAPRSIAAMDFSVRTHKCLHADTVGHHESTFLFTDCPRVDMHLNYVYTPYSGNATSHGLHVDGVILRIIREDLD